VAGNRRAYEAAIRRAASLVREQRWSAAIGEYNEALSEYPQDVAALTGLGLAYVRTEQPEKALSAYRRAADLATENPEVIARLAHTLEDLARWPEAARAYIRAARTCVRLRDHALATQFWRKAAMLDPQNLVAHRGLADAYVSQGQVRMAALQHLVIARMYGRQQNPAKAIDHCGTALELDPRNAEAQAILDALKNGRSLPDGPTARLQPDAEGKRTLDSFVVFEDIEAKSASLLSEEGHSSPAEMVRERSLAHMAEAAFSADTDPRAMQSNLLLAQGADFQARGLADQAIEAYSSAIRLGTNVAAVHFNLGLLLREKRQFRQAIEHLNQVLADPDYLMGARFAIGECYYAWGKTSEALQHLIEALRMIDSHTVLDGRAQELEAAYARLSREYAGQDSSESARHFAQSIVSFLSSTGWGDRVIQVREQLNSLASGGILVTLAETLLVPQAETVTTALCQIQEYLQRNMVFTALEECFWAIQQAPYFLPLHLHMADVLIAKGQLEEAVTKYTITAETYQARGDQQRAVAIYRRALDVAPMNVDVREKLIRLLVTAGQIDQAMEQYVSVADAYYQLAQVDRAIDKLDEALAYAGQGDPSRHWQVNVLHRIGDIYMQRLSWRQAIRAYQRIKRVDAHDYRSRSYLVDLYFKSGQRDQALAELDELLELYRSQGQPRELVSTLQDAIRSRPDELALHMRLAKVYLDMHKRKDAIAELDTIGELQLEMGMTREAIRTIQAIIRLGPDNQEGYRQLLAQLQGR
jgi:tetratricopeptide (TPR) repeat protein